MDKGKMHLGGASAKPDYKSDSQKPTEKAIVQVVQDRPAKFPTHTSIEPIGMGSASPLQMKGMKK